MGEIQRVYGDNYQVHGARKIWRQLNREGVQVGRGRVERLMRRMGLAGAVRGKKVRTALLVRDGVRAADLVKRQFAAGAPNRALGRGLQLCGDLGRHRLSMGRSPRMRSPAELSGGQRVFMRSTLFWTLSKRGCAIATAVYSTVISSVYTIPIPGASIPRLGPPSV